MRVAVTWNGPEDRLVHDQGLRNREVLSVDAVRGVAEALEQAGHEVRMVPADLDLAHNLEGWLGPDDMVFNLSYGVQGDSRYAHVPGLLEMAGFRYTGSSPLVHAVCLEKPLVKTVLRANGLPTPDSFTVDPGDDAPGDLGLGYPLVVKPCREAASLGLVLAHDRTELEEAVADIHDAFRQPALVERFVPGSDVMVPIIGNLDPNVLPIVQTRVRGNADSMLLSDDKAGTGRALDVRCPAPLDSDTRKRVRALGLAAYRAVGCRDWGRADMRLSPDGDIQILEINSLPGLDPHSSFPVAMAAAGMSRVEMVEAVLAAAAHRYRRRRPRLVGVPAAR